MNHLQEAPLHVVEAEKTNEAFMAVLRVCEAFQELPGKGAWAGTVVPVATWC